MRVSSKQILYVCFWFFRSVPRSHHAAVMYCHEAVIHYHAASMHYHAAAMHHHAAVSHHMLSCAVNPSRPVWLKLLWENRRKLFNGVNKCELLCTVQRSQRNLLLHMLNETVPMMEFLDMNDKRLLAIQSLFYWRILHKTIHCSSLELHTKKSAKQSNLSLFMNSIFRTEKRG